LGGGSAFHVELSAVMREIERAYQRRWRKLWIETDSSIVVFVAKKKYMVPCVLRNKWKNCLCILKKINYLITHIYRKGNKCANKLASLDLDNQGLTIWLEVPIFLNSLFVQDRIGLPILGL